MFVLDRQPSTLAKMYPNNYSRRNITYAWNHSTDQRFGLNWNAYSLWQTGATILQGVLAVSTQI